MLERHRSERDEAIGIPSDHGGQSAILRRDNVVRQRALCRVPPIAIDAERLHIDAAPIHRLNAIGPERIAYGRRGQRRSLDDVADRNHAVPMDINESDAPAVDRDAPAFGATLKRANGLEAAFRHSQYAGRASDQPSQNLSPSWHVHLQSTAPRRYVATPSAAYASSASRLKQAKITCVS